MPAPHHSGRGRRKEEREKGLDLDPHNVWGGLMPVVELVVCCVKGCGESGHDESSAWSNASRDHCSSAGADALPHGTFFPR